jgi:hypothetical protein
MFVPMVSRREEIILDDKYIFRGSRVAAVHNRCCAPSGPSRSSFDEVSLMFAQKCLQHNKHHISKAITEPGKLVTIPPTENENVL